MANTFAAELLLSDDDVLKPIGFYEFNADRLQMEASLLRNCQIDAPTAEHKYIKRGQRYA